MHQVLRICEDRQVEVTASRASCVSWVRVDDPWPSEAPWELVEGSELLLHNVFEAVSAVFCCFQT